VRPSHPLATRPQEDKYKLLNEDKLILIDKPTLNEYPYWESFDVDDVAESVWLEEDYLHIQQQHK
jgi:hypothetical protein